MRAQHINHRIYGQPVLRLWLNEDGHVFALSAAGVHETFIGRVIRGARDWYSVDTNGREIVTQTRNGAIGCLVHASLYRVRSIFDVWYPLACASADRADEARPLAFDAADEPESIDACLARTAIMRRARASRPGERGEASVLVLGALSALVGLALAPVLMLGMVAVCVALMALATRSARPERQARQAPEPHYADHTEGACEGSPTWEAAWADYDDQPSPPTTIYAL